MNYGWLTTNLQINLNRSIVKELNRFEWKMKNLKLQSCKKTLLPFASSSCYDLLSQGKLIFRRSEILISLFGNSAPCKIFDSQEK